ncbi:hypothetical protein FKP32DRAFT_1579542 [Trametes sanguinea]|nr:hypothetical protein FKP32DRAFT_1579542 [Trametes sanguinea]
MLIDNVDKRAIVPTIWPGGLGRVDTSTFDPQVRDDWRYVPETYEGICDWATVTKEDDESDDFHPLRRHLVYSQSVLPDEKRGGNFFVTLVLQGFLGDFNISVLGNWRRRDKASTAMQFINLESGGTHDAFAAQVRALQDIRALINAKVGGEMGEQAIDPNCIKLQRRVFTKVRPYGDQPPAIKLSNITDPGGHARKIAHQWRVDHIIPTGARRANGENMEIAPTALRRGDFVEVSVYADIHMFRRNRRVVTAVSFAMKEVVRLWTAEEWKVSVAD